MKSTATFVIRNQLISALAVIHNFIRIYDPDDLPEDFDGIDNDDENVEPCGWLQTHVTAEERGWAVARRDTIAKAMWRDYRAWGNYW